MEKASMLLQQSADHDMEEMGEQQLAASCDELEGMFLVPEPAVRARSFVRRALLGGLAGAALVACTLAVLAQPWKQSMSMDRANEMDEKIEFEDGSVQVAWVGHPTKCLDVQGGVGKTLHVWDCSKDTSRLLIPKAGTSGTIKWAENPEYCLDAPGNPPAQLQWWYCEDEEVSPERFQWRVLPDPLGFKIQSVAQPRYCVDVPDEGTHNGNRCQLWKCDIAIAVDIIFSVQQAVDCLWDTWSQWSTCSEDCGGGKHGRTRDARVLARNGGADCLGEDFESASCNTQGCLSDDRFNQAFNKYNQDKSRGIHKDEARQAMEEILGGDYKQWEADAQFDAADTDGNGEVSSDEFSRYSREEANRYAQRSGSRDRHGGIEEWCLAASLLLSLWQLTLW